MVWPSLIICNHFLEPSAIFLAFFCTFSAILLSLCHYYPFCASLQKKSEINLHNYSQTYGTTSCPKRLHMTGGGLSDWTRVGGAYRMPTTHSSLLSTPSPWTASSQSPPPRCCGPPAHSLTVHVVEAQDIPASAGPLQ